MKQGRTAGILFMAASGVLGAACLVLSARSDREAPRITFGVSDAVYREGMDREALFEGVTAYDVVDGDVTERIVIEKVIEDKEKGRAVVFYAVSDLSGNAAKASREFPAEYGGSVETAQGGREPFLTAGIEAEIRQMESAGAGEEPSYSGGEPSPLSGPEPSPSASPVREPEASPWEGNGPTPVSTERPTPTRVPALVPTPVPTENPTPPPTPDPAVPVLTLKASEVRVKAGQGPAWVDLIGTLSDDRDGYEALFKNLTVSRYDRDRAGEYRVTVYTEDSDGNRSATVPLTIIVE